jgi:nucleotide-binding universal stress UspA family protein
VFYKRAKRSLNGGLNMPATLETHRASTKDLQPRNILVPVDFSTQSHQALAYARALAECFGAVAHLVHIFERVPLMVGMEPVPPPLDFDRLRAESQQRLADYARELPPGKAGHTVVRDGRAVDDIISVARDLEVDLIVISAHGHSGVARVLFGSTAEGVIRNAPCAVLVLRPEEREFVETSQPNDQEQSVPLDLENILVPVDFSEAAHLALGYGIVFARPSRAKLICLHVLEVLPSSSTEMVSATERISKTVSQEIERTLRNLLRDQTNEIPREDILTNGGPSREILQMAEDRKVDLIVLGRHGKAGPGRFLLGSTAERVIRHACCPVLVVKERGE